MHATSTLQAVLIQFYPMRIRKQKIRVNSQSSDDDNQFLDDFLKPLQKDKQSSQYLLKQEATIKLNHYSVPSKMIREHSPKLQHLQQTEINKQIQNILKTIKKQEEVRKEKTREFLQRVAAEKEEQKRLHEFKIAERRIKKRLMLMERKEHLPHQLLSFVHSKAEEQPTKHLREKAKSVDDVVSLPHKEQKRHKTPMPAYTKQSREGTNMVREKIQLTSTQHYLPEINNGSAIHLMSRKHISRISAITLTKDLKIQQPTKPTELKQGKRRNYTESNTELQRLYQQGGVSRQKTERAVQLANRIQNRRRLKLKNLNQMDYKQAQRKIRLLKFLHQQYQ